MILKYKILLLDRKKWNVQTFLSFVLCAASVHCFPHTTVSLPLGSAIDTVHGFPVSVPGSLGVHLAWFTEGIEKNMYRNKQRNLGINCYILHFFKVTQVPAKGATNKSNSTRFKVLLYEMLCPQAFISLAILIIKVMQWCWYNPFWNKRTWICKCLDNRSWNPVCQMWNITKPACNVW